MSTRLNHNRAGSQSPRTRSRPINQLSLSFFTTTKAPAQWTGILSKGPGRNLSEESTQQLASTLHKSLPPSPCPRIKIFFLLSFATESGRQNVIQERAPIFRFQNERDTVLLSLVLVSSCAAYARKKETPEVATCTRKSQMRI